ncbi:protein OBERON 1 isoform X1 [Spinacia oleracea]|uniref:Protein OBERON 1 isoform X1 n=1 Tax=Spinacia oleracea TaxID=3562 RepID=A0A9R0HQH2_SPIOL|nr:protein OBERON 1 isoform X1 [Spinacia oleracea]
MTCENEDASGRGGELMEVDIADASNGCMTEIRENGLLLWPVLPQESGEGLPYAPVNWPKPGDIWGWRVGKRVAASGYYLDRYLYLPLSYQRSRRKRDGFASKLSVEQYVRARFPGTNVYAFFSSFSWKIPSKQAYLLKDEHGSFRISSEEMAAQSPPYMLPGGLGCKAGNHFCASLLEDQMSPSATLSCDICCSEPSFCRECCCILCCKTIDLGLGGYSFIRCEATVHDDLICGHAAHINCALRSYMAGTVGGSVGLDTEYYCRRCDTRTDLTKHVTRLLKTCESIESVDEIDKMLSVGACILRGSQKKYSQKLLNRIESILHKLKFGNDVKDVWKVEVEILPVPTPTPTGQLDYANSACTDVGEDDLLYQNGYLKLEEEINQVLQELKSSQEYEFSIAHDKLHAQKDNLFSLYQQVYKDKLELLRPSPSKDRDALLRSIAAREEYIKHELSKLRDMEKVANGFGKTPKKLLKEHFDLDLKD